MLTVTTTASQQCRMDTILSEFISRTSAAPGFARDWLKGHNWDLQEALQAFYVMKGVTQETKSSTLESSIVKPAISTSYVANNIDTPLNNLSPNKPPLRKTDALDIDDTTGKKLTRGISRATENVNLVSKARTEFAADFASSGQESSPCHLLLETPVYTFTIPNLTEQEEDFRLFLQKDLIETSTLVSLEQAGRLNWWAELGACQRLWPLATTGDGNCLLHAASLGMWGFHDRLLTLRRALHAVLSKSLFTEAFYRRWRWQTALQNKESGLVYCEEEWLKEWQNLLQMASTEPRSRASQQRTLDTVLEEESASHVYESLEEIHVLALAHVLRRPVIVIADTMLKDVTGEPFAPIPFGGIYLPLECAPAECHRSPLCLTYDAAHFSALVAMEGGGQDLASQSLAAIPLTDPNHKLLPVQFAVDPGKQVKWGQDENNPWVISKLTLNEKDKLGLLNEYLEITEISTIPLTGCSGDVVSTPYRTASAPIVNGYIEEPKRLGSLESEDSWTETNGMVAIHHKSKAAKQLQSVAKQFGSLGRSVSKKIKKNFSSLTRRGSSFKGDSCSKKSTVIKNMSSIVPPVCEPFPVGSTNTIVAAILHTEKRHEYQEEMIRNYLSSARARFLKEKANKGKVGSSTLDANKTMYSQPVQCVNLGCSMYGTAMTNYLCSACFSSQKEQEAEMTSNKKRNDGVVVTSGKSAFYTESDLKMIASVAQVPLGNRMNCRPDQTLYLAKSVFYHDNGSESPCTFKMKDLEKSVCRESKVNNSNMPLVSPFASTTLH